MNTKVIRLFFWEFFILLLCCEYSWMENVERQNGYGDVFAKNWPRLNMTITRCDLDVSGSGHANNKNMTFCNCNWGETFFVSLSRRPKCMKGWGQNQTEDLGCKFLFKNNIYVLALTIDKSKETIGQVMFGRSDGTKSQLTSYSLNKTSLWNVTWQQPDENLFYLNATGSLRWKSGNPTSGNQRYSGALFKFDVVAADTKNGKFQSSCLLLKIVGVRQYPLLLPKIETQSSVFTPIQITSHQLTSFATTPTETANNVATTSQAKTQSIIVTTSAGTSNLIATTKPKTITLFITTTQAITKSIIATTPAEMSIPISTSSQIISVMPSSFHSTSNVLAKSSQPTTIILSKSSHIESSSTFIIQSMTATPSSSQLMLPTSTISKKTDKKKFQKGGGDIMAPLIVGIVSPSLFILLILICLLFFYKKIKSNNRIEYGQGSSEATDEITMKQMPNNQKQYVQSWYEKHMNDPNAMEGEGSKTTQCSNAADVGDETTQEGPSKINENINQTNNNNDQPVGDSCSSSTLGTRATQGSSSSNYQQNNSIAPKGPSKDLPPTKACVETIRPSTITKLPPLLVKPIIANQPIVDSDQSCLDDCSPITSITVSQGTSNPSGLPTSRPKLPPLERTNKSNILPPVELD